MIRESLRDRSWTRIEEARQVQSWSAKVSGACTRACQSFESIAVFHFSSAGERWLWSLWSRRSKSKNYSTKWQSPSQIRTVKEQNHSFLANWPDGLLRSQYFVLLLTSLSVHISFIPLHPLVGLRPPSKKIDSFSHSVSLSLLHLYLTLSKIQHPEDVHSLCWCHERSEQSRNSQGYIA